MSEWNAQLEQQATAGSGPGPVPAELGKAAGLHLLGKKQEAVAELTRLLERQPDYAPAWRVRATLLSELGEAGRALADWDRFHSLAGGDAGTRLAWAQCMQQAGRWAEAAAQFEAVLEADPSRDAALLGLGLSQLRLHRAEEALALLEKYLERHPGDAAARFGRAVALQLTGELEQAVKLYEELVSDPLHGPDTLVNLIQIYRQQKNADRLEECSRKLLEMQPDSEAGQEAAAYAAFLREDYATAASHLRWLVERNGRPAERWMNLGLCLRKAGQLQAALEAYREALHRQPDLSEAHIRVAEILMELGRPEEALDACRNGIESCPDAADLYLLAAGIHEKAGRPEDAEALLQVLSMRQTGNADVLFRIGNLRYDRKAYGEAAEAYRATVDARPDWPEAWLNLGLALHESAQYDAAAQAFDRALALRPDWEAALRAAAVNALRQNLLEAALHYHRRLIETGHGDPEILYNTAVLNEQLGQKEEAELLYRQALEWKPDFAEALVGLGYVLESTGRPEEARLCWAKAMEIKPELAEEYFGLKG
ncbi:MAG: tetratricopeptide repeat protein [Bryobacteraceae bacterium]|nr:tetratricopeptide repeat protein [Bryobacteraceae bacterium]